MNLGVFFDKVFQNPAAYHLTNVTTPDPANSGSTALYFDSTHFGKKGQWLIAAEVKRVLSAK